MFDYDISSIPGITVDINTIERGEQGITFIPKIKNGILSWTNNGGLTNPDPLDLLSPTHEATQSALAAAQKAESAAQSVGNATTNLDNKIDQMNRIINEAYQTIYDTVEIKEATEKAKEATEEATVLAQKLVLEAKKYILPYGGKKNQVLIKNSDIDHDYVWRDYPRHILEYVNKGAFPAMGQEGTIYIAKNTNKLYRWDKTYIDISAGGGSSSGGDTPPLVNIELDKTLTLEGYAADAKAVGDRIKNITLSSLASQESSAIILDGGTI